MLVFSRWLKFCQELQDRPGRDLQGTGMESPLRFSLIRCADASFIEAVLFTLEALWIVFHPGAWPVCLRQNSSGRAG